MNSGQTLLTVGALVLVGNLQISIDNTVTRAHTLSLNVNANLIASAAAQALVDEISLKAFDEHTVTTRIASPDSLTSVSHLGPDSPSETISGPDVSPFQSAAKFNDVDDYHGYTRIVTDSQLGNDTLTVTVGYVPRSNFDSTSTSPTWYKNVTVTVKSSRLLAPVVVQSLSHYGPSF